MTDTTSEPKPIRILSHQDMLWLVAHGGDHDILNRSSTPEVLRNLTVPMDLLGGVERRNDWWEWFEIGIYKQFLRKKPDVEYAMSYINITLDSSQLGHSSWLAVGPSCHYKTLAEIPPWLNDLPSQRQHPMFAMDLRTWPKGN